MPGVTASTRAEFSRSGAAVGDMSTDIVRSMIFVGFVIGVAVAGLVAYNAMLSQLRDYAVLRALGLRARAALGLVLAQVGALVALGLALALGLVALLAWNHAGALADTCRRDPHRRRAAHLRGRAR